MQIYNCLGELNLHSMTCCMLSFATADNYLLTWNNFNFNLHEVQGDRSSWATQPCAWRQNGHRGGQIHSRVVQIINKIVDANSIVYKHGIKSKNIYSQKLQNFHRFVALLNVETLKIPFQDGHFDVMCKECIGTLWIILLILSKCSGFTCFVRLSIDQIVSAIFII